MAEKVRDSVGVQVSASKQVFIFDRILDLFLATLLGSIATFLIHDIFPLLRVLSIICFCVLAVFLVVILAVRFMPYGALPILDGLLSRVLKPDKKSVLIADLERFSLIFTTIGRRKKDFPLSILLTAAAWITDLAFLYCLLQIGRMNFEMARLAAFYAFILNFCQIPNSYFFLGTFEFVAVLLLYLLKIPFQDSLQIVLFIHAFFLIEVGLVRFMLAMYEKIRQRTHSPAKLRWREILTAPLLQISSSPEDIDTAENKRTRRHWNVS